MIFLQNKESGAYFVYNPTQKQFIRESYDVAWWVRTALDQEELILKNINEINMYRRVLHEIPSKDLTKMSKSDIMSYLHEYHPEILI